MWDVTLALIFVITGIWFWWRRKKFSTFKELGIPGPEPNIFNGNFSEILKTSPLECHERWIKKYGKIVGYFPGGTPTLLVSDVEMIKQILVKDFQKFRNRPHPFRNPTSEDKGIFSAHLISLMDKRWKEMRSIVTPSFTASKMRMVTPIMGSAVESLMNAIEKNVTSNKCFDIYELYRRLTLDAIGRTAFGIQTDVQNNPNDIILKSVKMIVGEKFNDLLVIIIESLPEFSALWDYVLKLRFLIKGRGKNPFYEILLHVKQIIEFRRQSKQNRRQDLLQFLMDASISESQLNSVSDENLITGDDVKSNENQNMKEPTGKSKQMSDNEIIDNAILFLIAGYETTSTALAFITHFLIHYPDVQQKVRDEIHDIIEKEGRLDYNSVQKIKYLEQVITESIRMYPPVHLFVNRQAEEDVQYGPYKIPKGMVIQIPVYHVNRNPEYWTDPENFDPSRFSPENKANINAMAFQSFGNGPRNCVGMRFAQLEIKLALANILNKYKLVVSEETDKHPLPLEIKEASLNPANGIKLKAVPI